ncbi:glycosyltransferase family 4 protein [Nocardiopsis sp. NPDC007018]|uniref:glycosyltransferase family 4 protein n=1 Tax=Nocardiopsis sp. NPDC007018 TaxID=3155721 RepID=UPI0033E0520E
MSASEPAPVLFVVPEASAPSGGHTYDRRIARALEAVLGATARQGRSNGAHGTIGGPAPDGAGVCGGGEPSGPPVRVVTVPGAWPRPGQDGARALGSVLAGAPEGARVLVDGLVACALPEVVVPCARRLRLHVLVHLPLADETGLAEVEARDLDAREGAALRCVDGVVATSAWAARRLVAHHGLAKDRVAVVRPGVEAARLAPGSGFEAGSGRVPRLLCVASLTPRKGHDVLFDALAPLVGLGWECVCAGPGTPPPLPGALAGRVRFTGPVTGPELEDAYASADLLVLPSRAETYGMVVTEALARGVPVVATRVGGVPEALGRAPDGRLPGVLVPPEDAVALERVLRGWLTDPGLRSGLRVAARLRREGLTRWPEAARELAAALGR